MCIESRWRLALCALLVLVAAGGSAAAQTTGTISGTVQDVQGQVIPGATVTLVDERTNNTRSAVTNERGEFQFTAMQPATYTVRVELAGFRTFERKSNVLNASAHLSLPVQLAVGELTEVVSVTAMGTQVETKVSGNSGLLTSTQIEQIQTKGRDVMALLRLMPGVRYEDGIEALGEDFGTLIPQVGGQRRHWNAVSVDGLTGNEASGSSRMSSAINIDAIAEVKVLLNTYNAEFGRSGGANIQIISKSGGAEYKGSTYWFARREGWNANRWENNKTGAPKPEYHFNTYGFNLGGPVQIPKLVGNGADKKLFFFYSLEAPRGQRPPGPLRRYWLPTELEKRGDFSQTLNPQGQPIFIRDPLSTQPCNITTGGAGCFPGNVIPQDRWDRNALALLNLFPAPNATSRAETGGNYNYTRQETADHPRMNNVLRLDWKKSVNNSFFGTLRTFHSKQTGSEITAGPPDWGFYDGTYIFADDSISAGWTRIAGSSSVFELSGGFGRRDEGFGAASEADLERLRKSDVGYNLAQFYPSTNPDGFIPRATFGGLPGTGADAVDMNYPDRLGATAKDYVASARSSLTVQKTKHTFKFGGELNYMQNREARGGSWSGQFSFNRDTNNPLDTNYTYANALLGVFTSYIETDRPGSTFNRGIMTEWYAQDAWRPTGKLTVDYGVRFLWYTPWWRPDERTANFRPDLYDPRQAPLLYAPALVNGVARAVNPATGEALAPVFIGAYVPGTGNQTNGMQLASDPGVPRGFRDPIKPLPEPRIGFAYDPFGNGTTVIKASAGVYHNARLGGGSLGNLRNPPFVSSPTLNYGMMSTMLAEGARLVERPGNVNALAPKVDTPVSYGFSAGVQRDIGWGTVVDVTYVRTLGRYLEMEININVVPDGARWLDVNPQNRDPRSTAALPAEFLRPYRGYQDIFVRDNWGESDYHGIQIQANRRYIRGVQFGVAYSFSKTRGHGDDDPGRVSLVRPMDAWHYSIAQFNQDHNLVINYTWDLPEVSSRWNNVFSRVVLDGWQLSGENAFVSGEWAPVVMTTQDGFDFSGGDGGTGGSLGGSNPLGTGYTNDGLRVVRPKLVGDPTKADGDPRTGLYNAAAFARPSGRGDFGMNERNVVQRPGVLNWNLAAFKNFRLGGARTFQFRVEGYNVLNHVQFQEINRTVTFDLAGNQVNQQFGIATNTRNARQVQASVRFSF